MDPEKAIEQNFMCYILFLIDFFNHLIVIQSGQEINDPGK